MLLYWLTVKFDWHQGFHSIISSMTGCHVSPGKISPGYYIISCYMLIKYFASSTQPCHVLHTGSIYIDHELLKGQSVQVICHPRFQYLRYPLRQAHSVINGLFFRETLLNYLWPLDRNRIYLLDRILHRKQTNTCRAQFNYCSGYEKKVTGERMLSNRRSLLINLGVVFGVVVVGGA